MSTICKYHGSACESPRRCEEFRPHKYDGDGTMERIDPDRLTLGNVVRMNEKDGRMSAFSDSVVTRIRVTYCLDRKRKEGREYSTFNTLAEAFAHSTKEDYIDVKLARPYLYEHIGGWLVGAEQYEVDGRRMLDTHKVVVMSSGAYDRRTATFSTQYHEVREAERKEEERKKR